MKKLTFKVTATQEGSVIALIKEVNKISCRLQIDIENGTVIATDIDESMIDTIFELINNHYTLLCVDIDNSAHSDIIVPTVESATEVSAQPEIVAMKMLFLNCIRCIQK